MRTQTNYYKTEKEYLKALEFYNVITTVIDNGTVKDGMFKGFRFINFKLKG